MTTIDSNLQRVHARIAAACEASGRNVQDVALLAVSKTFGADVIRLAYAAGQNAFGENYIQEAVDKMDRLRGLPLVWHGIGPIQSNKTRQVAERFDWVHTIDRLRIARRLSAQRPAQLPPLQVCIQVNIDGGPTKAGVAPDDVPELAQAVAALPHLQLRGLMAIPEPAASFEAGRAVHGRMRGLLDQLNAAGLSLDTLSLGMSGDLEAAIAAGSTMVRVGAAIFGTRAAAG